MDESCNKVGVNTEVHYLWKNVKGGIAHVPCAITQLSLILPTIVAKGRLGNVPHCVHVSCLYLRQQECPSLDL